MEKFVTGIKDLPQSLKDLDGTKIIYQVKPVVNNVTQKLNLTEEMYQKILKRLELDLNIEHSIEERFKEFNLNKFVSINYNQFAGTDENIFYINSFNTTSVEKYTNIEGFPVLLITFNDGTSLELEYFGEDSIYDSYRKIYNVVSKKKEFKNTVRKKSNPFTDEDDSDIYDSDFYDSDFIIIDDDESESSENVEDSNDENDTGNTTPQNPPLVEVENFDKYLNVTYGIEYEIITGRTERNVILSFKPTEIVKRSVTSVQLKDRNGDILERTYFNNKEIFKKNGVTLRLADVITNKSLWDEFMIKIIESLQKPPVRL